MYRRNLEAEDRKMILEDNILHNLPEQIVEIDIRSKIRDYPYNKFELKDPKKDDLLDSLIIDTTSYEALNVNQKDKFNLIQDLSKAVDAFYRCGYFHLAINPSNIYQFYSKILKRNVFVLRGYKACIPLSVMKESNQDLLDRMILDLGLSICELITGEKGDIDYYGSRFADSPEILNMLYHPRKLSIDRQFYVDPEPFINLFDTTDFETFKDRLIEQGPPNDLDYTQTCLAALNLFAMIKSLNSDSILRYSHLELYQICYNLCALICNCKIKFSSGSISYIFTKMYNVISELRGAIFYVDVENKVSEVNSIEHFEPNYYY